MKLRYLILAFTTFDQHYYRRSEYEYLIMQQLTRNRFVSPTTAGTMDAARLGVLMDIMVFGAAGFWTKMLTAFGFALAGTLIFMKILDKIRFKDPVIIPLVGLMFGGILNSVTTFFAYIYNLIQSISSWMQGDFSLVMSGRYEILYLSVPLVALARILRQIWAYITSASSILAW
ncbi:UNVERIFIED_CONTAM: ABC-type enterochelin transport system permease subunit [Paenibacillus sp. PvR008]